MWFMLFFKIIWVIRLNRKTDRQIDLYTDDIFYFYLLIFLVLLHLTLLFHSCLLSIPQPFMRTHTHSPMQHQTRVTQTASNHRCVLLNTHLTSVRIWTQVLWSQVLMTVRPECVSTVNHQVSHYTMSEHRVN